MATVGGQFNNVLSALALMQSNASGEQKKAAMDFLQKFQKTEEAWTFGHGVFMSTDSQIPDHVKHAAANALKVKIMTDLSELPRDQLPSLRDSLLGFLSKYKDGPRAIRIQLCIALAHLAIQMLEWHNVIEYVGSALGNDAGYCILEFLKILPEELNNVTRKIRLSEVDLTTRTRELLEDNTDTVLRLLLNLAQSTGPIASSPLLVECLAAWLKEIPLAEVVKTPLLDMVIGALDNDNCFDAAVECFSIMFRDTSDNHESLDVIKILYPRILALRPKITEYANAHDEECFKGITRLFTEAGENWTVIIAQEPEEYESLVEAILECCAKDEDRGSLGMTFDFWYELSLLLTSNRYFRSKQRLDRLYQILWDVMVKHLEYPRGSEKDLFDGDRDAEEKFRSFRHLIGDVLKDCCEVVGIPECLHKVFFSMRDWIGKYASQVTTAQVPNWQALEAPLFALRALGRMVPPDESKVLHQIIPILVQIPDHEKLRFQAILAIGRYTEWTRDHHEFLPAQLQFVLEGFDNPSAEVVRASALSLRFFGVDCFHYLKEEVANLHSFYNSKLDRLPSGSQEEVTEGVACVLGALDPSEIYDALKSFCDPIIERLKIRANTALEQPANKVAQEAVADTLNLITIFITNIHGWHPPGTENGAVVYCQEILPILFTIGQNFTKSTPILERLCRCWRHMVLSFRTDVLSILPALAEHIIAGFENTRQGCFLWATDSVLREFAAGIENVTPETSAAAYKFFEQQAFTFLRIMNDLPPQELPDVIEDFFRLLMDALVYHHDRFLRSAICTPVFTAAITALSLQQLQSLTATMHYILDFLTYATDSPAHSKFQSSYDGADKENEDDGEEKPPQKPIPNSPQNKATVNSIVSNQGEALVQRILTGMMFTFPRDLDLDASAIMIALFEIAPQQTAGWMVSTFNMLPGGSLKAGESDILFAAVNDNLQTGDTKKIRTLIKDFTFSYRRRNVEPEDGLGSLAGKPFQIKA